MKSRKYTYLVYYILFLACNPVYAEKDIVVALKWKHQFEFAGIYAAIEDGIYKKYGLNVSVVEPSSGLDSIDLVSAGKCDIGISSTSIIRHLKQDREPLTIIGASFVKSPAVLIVSKGVGVLEPNNLLNFKLMLEKDSDEVKLMLLSLGVHLTHDLLVPHDYTTKPLLEGKVVGMTAYVTDEPYMLERDNFSYIVFDPNNYGIDVFWDIFFTKKSIVDEDPNLIENFILATQKGWETSLENPERITDIIIKKYHSKHSRDHLLYEAEMLSFYLEPGKLISEIHKVNIGVKDSIKWRKIESIYKNFRLVDADFNILDYVNGLSERGVSLSDKFYSLVMMPYLLIGFALMLILIITERLRCLKIIIKIAS